MGIGVWKNGNFLKMWSGQTISLFGSQITTVAVPLVAAITLNATPMQMGVLHAAEYSPFLVFGLFAGVLVDRWPKRRVLIWSDIARAVLFGSIPMIAWLGSLNIFYLCVIAFLAGIFSTFYAIGYQSILPYMIGKDQLVDANMKMEMSRSIAGVAGPGFAGIMVQWMSGVFAILLDACSFVISGVMTCYVSVEERKRPLNGEVKSSIWRDMGKGFQTVFGNPALRSIALCTATTNFFLNMTQALLILYATRELGFLPSVVGLIMTISSGGAVLSSLLSKRLLDRFGQGPIIVITALCQGIGGLFMFGAVGSKWFSFGMMLLSLLIVYFAMTLYNIAQVSLRQSITEQELLGRMNATMRFFVWGVIPLGAITGGTLGSLIGLYPTIQIAACGGLLPFLWVYFSPIMKKFPGNNVKNEVRVQR